MTQPAHLRYHHSRFGSDLLWRAQEDERSFAGYASLHGVTDSYGTRMVPGCWTRGGLDDQPYALLWMHNPDVVLGTFTAREDDTGLWVQGRYDDTDVATRARAQAMSGSAPGLSVGFNVLAVMEGDPDALTACTLVETSQITLRLASTPGAELASVRAREDSDTLRRLRLARARGLTTLTGL